MLCKINGRYVYLVTFLLCAQTALFITVMFRTSEKVIDFNVSQDLHERKCVNCNSSTLHGRFVNSVVTDYAADIRHRLVDLISRNATSRDPQLISLLRDLLDEPSDHMVKTVQSIAETPQSKEISIVLSDKKSERGGFFVEVGGLDGERSSNTLWLEQKRGWTGLLIEMDPYFYTQLRGKNRKCWSINACISPVDRPTMLHIKESSGGAGVLNTGSQSGLRVPCFTLESMLAALNTTHVDYFSLDVEGFELEVLKTIDFSRIDITTLSVEYVHGRSSKEEMRSYMDNVGYTVHRDIHYHNWDRGMFVDDFIFVKK